MHILLLIGWKRAYFVCSDWLDYFNQLESLEYTKPIKTQRPAGAVVLPLSSAFYSSKI